MAADYGDLVAVAPEVVDQGCQMGAHGEFMIAYIASKRSFHITDWPGRPLPVVAALKTAYEAR